MCFSEENSLFLFILGLVSTYYIKNKYNNFNLWFPLLYFTFMELLQYIGYISLRKNNKILNKIGSYLSYFYICFQPLIFNLFISNFIPKSNLPKMNLIYKLCLVEDYFYYLEYFLMIRKIYYVISNMKKVVLKKLNMIMEINILHINLN